jgi:tRNA(fMet)-specific endonuclease VapC
VSLRYLLDTNVVSDPVSKSPNPRLLKNLRLLGDECAIAAPVWHELKFGCSRLPKGKRRTAIENYLTDVVRVSFPILPYDQAAATRHALERARLEELGLPSPFVDGQIAAIALVSQLILVSRNGKDFERYEDLAVEDWTT